MAELLDEVLEHREFAIFLVVLPIFIFATSLVLYHIGPRLKAASEEKKMKALAKTLATRHRALKPSANPPTEKPFTTPSASSGSVSSPSSPPNT
jgi:hypothetical protein